MKLAAGQTYIITNGNERDTVRILYVTKRKVSYEYGVNIRVARPGWVQAWLTGQHAELVMDYSKRNETMYQVYFVNHYYFSYREFDSLEAAIAYAKNTSFDCAIYLDGDVVASYGIFSGVRYYEN